MGNLYQAQGQLPEAVDAYRQVLAIQPNLVAVYNNLGYTLQLQGKWKEAIACYQKALEIQPNCTEADVNLGNALHAQGKLSPEQQAHYARLNYDLGVARQKAGNLKTSVAYYRQAIAIKSDLVDAHDQLGSALTEQDKFSTNSFDIFDTLIARFCIDPNEIFLHVEQITGFKNFAYYRKKAEHYLLRNAEDYDLEDIYLRLAEELNLIRCDLEYLKDAEVEAEIQNVIGIKENLEKVEDGDVLVSDMYLPEDLIQKMLRKAGLEKQVSIFLKAKGKRNGKVWREIIDKNIKIGQHIGDNPHSDVYMAERYGIRANLYQSAHPSPVENALNEIGAKSLARVIRKIRLANHFEDPFKKEFYNSFVQGNIVILVTFSVFLLRILKQINVKQYLFSSRDCYYLHKIFRQFVRNCDFSVCSEYFFTSRLARVKCSEDYRSYLLHIVNKQRDSAIVDLAGTGLSLSYLFRKISEDFTLPIVFFHHINFNRVKKIYQGIEPDDAIFSLIPDGIQTLNIDALEIFNSVKQPMVKDVLKQGENEYVPVFCSKPIPGEISKIIDCAEQVIDDFSNHLNQEIVGEIIHGVDFGNLTSLSVTLYHQLCHNELFSYFINFHFEENKRVERELSAMLARGC